MSDFRQPSKTDHVLSCLTQIMGLFLVGAVVNLVFLPHNKAVAFAAPAARAAVVAVDHRAIAADAVSVDDVATVQMSIAAYDR